MTIPFIPNKTVEVPDIPIKDSLQLPAGKTAIIIVDMQNDFVKPGGTLVGPVVAEIIDPIQKLLTTARADGIPIAYTQDTHSEGDREWTIWPEHCRAGTWGWEIIDELKPQVDDLVCQKSRYDGFYDTSLDHYLTRVWQVEHVVIVGTVSNICVLHTAGSAGLRWFHVVLPANGIAALSEFEQALTLHQVSALYTGDVVGAADGIEFV